MNKELTEVNATNQLNIKTYIAKHDEVGLRLDAFLRATDETYSQRTIKRLLSKNQITINEKNAKASQLMRLNDVVCIYQELEENLLQAYRSLYDKVSIIKAQNGFYAFYKPAGLHTVKIKGAATPSLELYIEKNWSTLWDNWLNVCQSKQARYPHEELGAGLSCCAGDESSTPDQPILLNRLDLLTSGIILAGTEATKTAYLKLEDQGVIKKKYFAIVYGEFKEKRTITYALYNDNKTKMEARAIDGEAKKASPLRHTFVEPIKTLSLSELKTLKGFTPALEDEIKQRNIETFTLVTAQIAKGGRHQIRAHLAEEGFPILGDSLYATDYIHSNEHTSTTQTHTNEEKTLFLHHFSIELPNFQAEVFPEWAERSFF